MKRLRPYRKSIIAFVGILVGIVFIQIGLHLGEEEIVLRKAVRVCLECIGIG